MKILIMLSCVFVLSGCQTTDEWMKDTAYHKTEGHLKTNSGKLGRKVGSF